MVGLYIVSFVIHSFHLNISIKVLFSFWFSMACQMKKKLLLLLLVLLVSNLQHCVNGTQQVPCFFIFGDSLSDNGNNNNLVTKAKANYQPYGIDFPGDPPEGLLMVAILSISLVSIYLFFFFFFFIIIIKFILVTVFIIFPFEPFWSIWIGKIWFWFKESFYILEQNWFWFQELASL